MHAVRDLVRPDADQRRLDAVDAADEAVEFDVPELFGERLLCTRVEELPERTAAADEVLPEAALRLVDAERARVADRQVLQVTRQLVRVEAVPVFVHRREERLHRLGVVVRRDPDVVDACPRGERMLRRIEPPRVLVAKAEQRDDLLCQPFLRLDREVSAQEGVVDVVVPQLGDQRDQLGLELGECLTHFGGAGLRLVVVEQVGTRTAFS